ncbi:MAG: hypothetical protein ACRD2A_18330 [Vicinamibacterales bacterium]
MADRSTSPEIDALLQEDRRFPPSDAWRRSAQVSDPDIYRKAVEHCRIGNRQLPH